MRKTGFSGKGWLWVIPYFLFVTTSEGQFPVGIDIVYDFIKTNSIHRYQVNWNKEDKQFWSAMSTAHTLKDSMNAFIQVFKDLDDVHSQLHYNNQNYGYLKTDDEHGSDRLHQLAEMARATSGQIKCELLDNQYAYIRIPGNNIFDATVANQYGWTLRDTIDYWKQKKQVKGFVIDLRLDRGGNLNPMLNGVSHLLGDGVILNEVDISYLRGGPWKIQKGIFMGRNFAMPDDNENENTPLSEIPVVVLTGPLTASSGSITAIAFRGRKNAISIGEPTAGGYTVSNEYYQFAPNLFLNLAISRVADRNLRFYPAEVEPDIVVKEGDDFENLMRDQKIKRALLWLKENTK